MAVQINDHLINVTSPPFTKQTNAKYYEILSHGTRKFWEFNIFERDMAYTDILEITFLIYNFVKHDNHECTS